MIPNKVCFVEFQASWQYVFCLCVFVPTARLHTHQLPMRGISHYNGIKWKHSRFSWHAKWISLFMHVKVIYQTQTCIYSKYIRGSLLIKQNVSRITNVLRSKQTLWKTWHYRLDIHIWLAYTANVSTKAITTNSMITKIHQRSHFSCLFITQDEPHESHHLNLN